jgi:hypothetical protein
VRGQLPQPGGQGQIGRAGILAIRGPLRLCLKLRGQGCALRSAPGAPRRSNGILGLLRDSGDLLVAGLGWGILGRPLCSVTAHCCQRLPR